MKVGSACLDANDVSAQMCLPRFCLKDNRTDGRFFDCAQNDMLCNQHPRDTSVIPAPNTVILRKSLRRWGGASPVCPLRIHGMSEW